MITQALILAPLSAGPTALARLTEQVRRHGVERVHIVARDAAPPVEGQAFILEANDPLDINLWDLALAAGQGSVLATGPGGGAGGVAVLDRAELARFGGADAGLFARLAAAPDLQRKAYDRPRLDLDAEIVRGAVIFDRDGVINEDTVFPYLPEHIVWTQTGKAAVKAVNDAGLYAFVATNQSGVARGMYGEQHVRDLHAWMNAELIAAGAHIDAFEYSPFHPDGAIKAYRRETACRKPGPDMLNRLIAGHSVDPARTVMIGDRPGDVAAGEAAGVEGILFQGGDLAAALAPVIARLTR